MGNWEMTQRPQTTSLGNFIVVEGGDGSGKSTLLRRIESHFAKLQLPFHCTREPGGTPVADEIREILLRPGRKLSSRAELFLFEAARAEHVENVIRPKLAQGIHILCDRFTHSTLAFQGYARGMGAKLISDLNSIATGGLEPDAVIWLKIKPELAQKRIELRGGEKSRLDAEKSAFHEAVFLAFEKMASLDPSRFIVLDAAKSPEEVFEELLGNKLWHKLWQNISKGDSK